jgi:hypothetical protein
MAKRYQRDNNNPYKEVEQTTQWSKDTNGTIRICIRKKNRQQQWQKDTNGAIRICIRKKNRQHNGKKIPTGQ